MEWKSGRLCFYGSPLDRRLPLTPIKIGWCMRYKIAPNLGCDPEPANRQLASDQRHISIL